MGQVSFTKEICSCISLQGCQLLRVAWHEKPKTVIRSLNFCSFDLQKKKKKINIIKLDFKYAFRFNFLLLRCTYFCHEGALAYSAGERERKVRVEDFRQIKLELTALRQPSYKFRTPMVNICL